MAKFTVKIDSILGGISPNLYRGGAGQFSASIGIDPDLPINPDSTTDRKTGGVLTPSSYTDFSGTLLDSYVNQIVTCPQDANFYVHLATGKILQYSSSFVESHIDLTFTVTIASPAVFSATAHGITTNDRVRLYTTGALATGLSPNTTYYVISAGLTADAFQLSETQGGTAINTSGSQSGTHRFAVEGGGGAAYYNNYIYFAKTFSISRYGPLDNSPVLVHNVWRSAVLGTNAALGNTTYPQHSAITYGNHPMHLHSDNKLYTGDYETATTSTDE